MFMMIKKLLVIFCFTFGFTLRSSDPLKLVSLEADPLAICNDGSPAVYYRPPLNISGDTKKLLIYLKGGGFCVPFVPGKYSSQNRNILVTSFKVWTVNQDVKKTDLCVLHLLTASLSWIGEILHLYFIQCSVMIQMRIQPFMISI